VYWRSLGAALQVSLPVDGQMRRHGNAGGHQFLLSPGMVANAVDLSR